MRLLRNVISALIAIPEKLNELKDAVNNLARAWEYQPSRKTDQPKTTNQPKTTGIRGRIRISRGKEIPEWENMLAALARSEARAWTKLSPASEESMYKYGIKFPARTFCETLRKYVHEKKLPYRISYVKGPIHGSIHAEKII